MPPKKDNRYRSYNEIETIIRNAIKIWNELIENHSTDEINSYKYGKKSREIIHKLGDYFDLKVETAKDKDHIPSV